MGYHGVSDYLHLHGHLSVSDCLKLSQKSLWMVKLLLTIYTGIDGTSHMSPSPSQTLPSSGDPD